MCPSYLKVSTLVVFQLYMFLCEQQSWIESHKSHSSYGGNVHSIYCCILYVAPGSNNLLLSNLCVPLSFVMKYTSVIYTFCFMFYFYLPYLSIYILYLEYLQYILHSWASFPYAKKIYFPIHYHSIYYFYMYIWLAILIYIIFNM